jgi:cobalt/nickel transport system permease protein
MIIFPRMHFHFLDDYSSLDSPIHRLPVVLKLTVALVIVVTLAIVPVRHVVLFAAVGFFLFAVAAASLIPGMFLVKRLVFLEPFVLGVGALSVFQPHGGAIFASLAIRSSLCLLCLTLLANTTPFGEMLAVLRRLRVPALLITTLALMHRYLFVVLDESQRMRRARASRSFVRSRTARWRALATVCAQLFVRSTERAERVYRAMCARGWSS